MSEQIREIALIDSNKIFRVLKEIPSAMSSFHRHLQSFHTASEHAEDHVILQRFTRNTEVLTLENTRIWNFVGAPQKEHQVRMSLAVLLTNKLKREDIHRISILLGHFEATRVLILTQNATQINENLPLLQASLNKFWRIDIKNTTNPTLTLADFLPPIWKKCLLPEPVSLRRVNRGWILKKKRDDRKVVHFKRTSFTEMANILD